MIQFSINKYRIVQNFRWIKISLNAQTLYWHENFTEFNFVHSASCSPGSSGWSSRMNTPRPVCTIDLSLLRFLGLILIAACRSQQRWRKAIAPTIRVRQDRAKPKVQRGSTTVATRLQIEKEEVLNTR